jgi:hypothetical protein
MDPQQQHELSRLLSSLLARVHSLSGADLAVLMEVDERMRRGDAAAGDLARLQAIAQRAG